MRWYEPLRAIQSLGSQTGRPGSLAGLAAARREHRGQFWTPDPLAAFMWRLLEPAMNEEVAKRQGRISILDNSVGSGRLLQFARPDKHAIFGVDVDEQTLAALGKAAQAAGFTYRFEPCGMEAVSPQSFDLGLINPPFSVHLQSPLLAPYPCTTYGKYGPSTACLSHAYALAQAAEACEVVLALLPATFAEEVWAKPEQVLDERDVRRLAALLELPAGVFREENTEVRVSLLLLHQAGRTSRFGQRIKVESLDASLPDLGIRFHGNGKAPRLIVRGIDDDGPSITLPVTGDPTVRVVHDSRRLGLRFNCGLTQAKVMNAVLHSDIRAQGPADHRWPKGFVHTGQGVLDLEVHLAQDDPMASLQRLLAAIEAAGGRVQLAPGLMNYVRSRIRRSARQATPMRHTVWMPGGAPSRSDRIVGRSRKPQPANPTVWGSPTIGLGQEVVFRRNEKGGYEFMIDGRSYLISPEDLYKRFEVIDGAATPGWTVVHEGLRARYPALYQAWEKRARSLGIDQWLSWAFQFDDVIEAMLKPRGAVLAWNMGLGKARAAIALIVLSGCKHGLITTEAGLIDELVIELEGLPIAREDWQVIERPEQLACLRRINVLSYERLRMPLHQGAGKKAVRARHTYAGALRRRIGVLCADEGDVLANPESDQSRALWQISAKRRFLLSGTPIRNYARDALPILAFTGGDGTAAQPWGWHRGYLEKNWRESVSHARRGRDAFRETFVEFVWVTNEFADTLQEGGKREIPRIVNLEAYRQMLAPHIKRRIDEEPEVARYVTMPKGERRTVELPWDDGHLAYYLRVVEDFAHWYRTVRREDGRHVNLVAILARIQAVQVASDYPQHGVEGFGCYHPLTSKQRWVLEELERLTAQGHRTVLYAQNPGQLELLGRELARRGVEHMLFHGGIPIQRRTRELNERFRRGSCPVLLASLGVTQKGLNLWQADRWILLSRSFSAKVEEQAIKRLLRPQQKKHVLGTYVHVPGGIEIYQEQLVRFKRDAYQAGLDWAQPQTEEVEFLHLDTVINRMVEDIARLRNLERRQLRAALGDRKERACA